MSQSIALAMSLTIVRGRDDVGKLEACLGVDVQASLAAPGRGRAGVDIRLDGDLPVALGVLQHLLGGELSWASTP